MFSLSYIPNEQLFGYDVQCWNPVFLSSFLKNEDLKHQIFKEENITTISIKGMELHFRYSEKPSLFHVYIREKEFKIFDEFVMGKRKEEIINLLASFGYTDFIFEKEFGVGMLEFEKARATFFFENQFIDECVVEIY